MIGVGLDGGLELVKTVKRLLSPQALDELDLDDAAVGRHQARPLESNLCFSRSQRPSVATVGLTPIEATPF